MASDTKEKIHKLAYDTARFIRRSDRLDPQDNEGWRIYRHISEALVAFEEHLATPPEVTVVTTFKE